MVSIKGNTWIRYLMEGFLDIGLCCALNYYNADDTDNGLHFHSAFLILNTISFAIFTVAIIAFPVWVLVFYCRYFESWSNEDFQEKYGAVFEGIELYGRS